MIRSEEWLVTGLVVFVTVVAPLAYLFFVKKYLDYK
jgi:hypothetical protein